MIDQRVKQIRRPERGISGKVAGAADVEGDRVSPILQRTVGKGDRRRSDRLISKDQVPRGIRFAAIQVNG